MSLYLPFTRNIKELQCSSHLRSSVCRAFNFHLGILLWEVFLSTCILVTLVLLGVLKIHFQKQNKKKIKNKKINSFPFGCFISSRIEIDEEALPKNTNTKKWKPKPLRSEGLWFLSEAWGPTKLFPPVGTDLSYHIVVSTKDNARTNKFFELWFQEEPKNFIHLSPSFWQPWKLLGW